jgi:hypothetical protein
MGVTKCNQCVTKIFAFLVTAVSIDMTTLYIYIYIVVTNVTKY